MSDTGQEDFTPKGGVPGFLLMVFGMFMAILDIQIVASSLPEIRAGVSATLSQAAWVQTAYLIAEVVMIPLSGWLARVMGSHRLFAASAGGFTAASALCALSWSPESLIFFRAVQGFVGGAMIPTVFAAIYKMLPPERRTMGVVLAGLTATTAPALGPTMGGWLTEHFSWHWLFLVNLVPGVIVTVAVPLVVRIDRAEPGLLRQIDFIGILLVAGFLGSLEFVLDEGPRNDWFEDDLIVIFTAVSAISGLLLPLRERRVKYPIIPLEVFTNRNLTVGCILGFALGMVLYGQSYILPQVLAGVRGFNALQIGQVMAVTGIAMFFTAPLAGGLSSKLDARGMILTGFLLTGLGLYLNAQMTPQVGFWALLPPQVARGVGLMMAMVPITTVAMGTLPVHLVSTGSAMFNVFRNMGGAVGLAMINTILENRVTTHAAMLAGSIPSTGSSARAMMEDAERLFAARGLPDPGNAAEAMVLETIRVNATVMAWNDIFFVMALMALAALPLVLLLARPRQTAGPAH